MRNKAEPGSLTSSDMAVAEVEIHARIDPIRSACESAFLIASKTCDDADDKAKTKKRAWFCARQQVVDPKVGTARAHDAETPSCPAMRVRQKQRKRVLCREVATKGKVRVRNVVKSDQALPAYWAAAASTCGTVRIG